tara:strand:+ start:112 stop:255 length:144 start_codon:yes stop_codon:yes gene_type:complete
MSYTTLWGMIALKSLKMLHSSSSNSKGINQSIFQEAMHSVLSKVVRW